MQLVAYGAQDVYLTGQAQITFFKIVYRRHTNFAMESIEQVFNGTADFGRKVTATISRNGDLIYRAYLRVQLPDVAVQAGCSFRWLNWVGHILIQQVEVEVGGQKIDTHYGDWLHIWNELTQTAGHMIGYANMVGNTPSLTSVVTAPGASAVTVPGQVLYIPLEFWFNRNPGLALPLIGLQYHEVKINLTFADVSSCVWSANSSGTTVPVTGTNTSNSAVTVPSLPTASLYIDYIYLDTDERRRFAQVAHEYLITQLQYTGEESTNQANYKYKMNFNHPCKELIWVVQPEDNTNGQLAPYGAQWFNYTDAFENTYASTFPFASGASVPTNNASAGGMPGVAAGGANGVFIPAVFGSSAGGTDGGVNPVSYAKIQLNGHDRFSGRDGRYFNLVQPYQHHENVPKQGINVYSFALKPEEHQPSGTCNMSRIDSAVLSLTLTSHTITSTSGGTPVARAARIRVYAVNYNVFRIMSGMGGLAYSN